MFSSDQLIPFLIAALALNLTPGADMTFVMARSATQGRTAGICASLGIAAGSFIHSVLAAIGVSALLAHSPATFTALKVVGAAYLCYLAWKALAHGVAASASSGGPTPSRRGLGKAFVEGMLTNLFNPKVALFMLAFLPQFVNPVAGSVVAQILILGLLFNIGGTAVNCVVAYSFAAAAKSIAESRSLRPWLDRFAAAIFIYLALRLAFARTA